MPAVVIRCSALHPCFAKLDWLESSVAVSRWLVVKPMLLPQQVVFEETLPSEPSRNYPKLGTAHKAATLLARVFLDPKKSAVVMPVTPHSLLPSQTVVATKPVVSKLQLPRRPVVSARWGMLVAATLSCPSKGSPQLSTGQGPSTLAP